MVLRDIMLKIKLYYYNLSQSQSFQSICFIDLISSFHYVVFLNQSLKNQLEASMPGMEAAITTLRERVDGPDVMAASRAAQHALIGSSKTRQQTATLRVSHLSLPLSCLK